jgi:hypothetical protein
VVNGHISPNPHISSLMNWMLRGVGSFYGGFRYLKSIDTGGQKFTPYKYFMYMHLPIS